MKRTPLLAASIVLALALAIALSACRQQPQTPQPAEQPVAPSTEPTKSITPTPPAEQDGSVVTDPLTVRLYFTRGEKIGVAARQVDRSRPAVSAIQELLVGPTAQEKEFGLGTVIPAGTTVNSVVISNGLATVDLSSKFASGGGSLSMTLRAAQVVCTLTQFSSVKSVAFKLDGKPVNALGGEGVKVGPRVTRADFEDSLPAILVEYPAVGETVSRPVVVSGSSNVFEATHQLELTDPDGLIIATKTITATSGTGTRGTWRVSLPYPTVKRAGLGALIAFEYSAEDGKRINIVEVPVWFLK